MDVLPFSFLIALVVSVLAGAVTAAILLGLVDKWLARRRRRRNLDQARANLRMPDAAELQQAADQVQAGMRELLKGAEANARRSKFLEWVVQTVHETRRLTEPESDDCAECSRIADELLDRVCGNRDKRRFPDSAADRRQVAEAVLSWSADRLEAAGVKELRENAG